MVKATSVATLFIYLASTVYGFDAQEPLPFIPKQFTAELVYTAHLVDRSKEYPPAERHINFAYDALRGLAYAKVLKGYLAGRTYIRRYDMKREYMLGEGKYPECRRTSIGEHLPEVIFPRDIVYIGIKRIGNEDFNHWVHESQDSRVQIFHHAASGAPFRVTEESIFEGKVSPLTTYELRNIQLGKPNDSFFELPSMYSEATCDRHVGGFPYIHLFYHYLKF